MKILTLFILLFFSNILIAAPLIKICLNDCENKTQLELSKITVNRLKHLFKPHNNAKDERKCIAKGIAVIEQDIYQRITEKSSGNTAIDAKSNQINNQDEVYNTRQFLIYLLDQKYIHQHILRRAVKRTRWLGFTESTSVIQSIDNPTTYAVDSSDTPIGKPPLITELKRWQKEKSFEGVSLKIKQLISTIHFKKIHE